MEHLVPARLAQTLREAGLRPAGPLAVLTGPPRWTALGPDGTRWAVTELAPALATRARERAGRLAAVDHPHLAQPGPVLAQPDGSVAVLVAAEPGVDLEVLLAAHGPLDDGEAVSLLVPVAEALAAVHAAGLAHGRLGAGDVLLTPTGPVLVDAAGGAEPVPTGDALVRAQRQDVAALVVIAEGLVARLPGPVLEVCGSGATASAADLAREWAAATPPTPLRMPDAAVLARLTLRRLAAAGQGRAGEGAALGVDARLGGRRGRAPGARSGYPEHAAGAARRPRARRSARRRRRGLLLTAVLALVVVGGLSGAVASGLPARLGLVAGAEPAGPTPAGPAAQRAAEWLSEQRARALATADRPALLALTEPGSPAALADRALELTPVPLVVVHATAAPPTSGACPIGLVCVPVSMVARVSGGTSTAQRVVLALRPGTWRVVEVLDG